MVVEQPRAQLKIVIFGDGTEGVLLSLKEDNPDEEGIPMYELKLRPSKDMQYMYNLSTEELVANRWIVKTSVPQSKVFVINEDSRVGRVLVLCGLNGNPTKTEKIHEILLDQIKSLSRDREAKLVEIAYLHEDRRRLTCKRGMYMKDVVDNLIKPAFAVRYSDYASTAPPGTKQDDDGMGAHND